MAFDYTDDASITPLIRAIVANNQSDVKDALFRGFSANLPDNRGWTPLHHAATNDTRSDCLKELLSHPTANINSQTYVGETALFIACQNNCPKIVGLLLNRSNCKVNLGNSEGVTPLHVACAAGNLPMIKCVVEAGGNVNAQDFNGYTPLHETVAPNRDNKDEVSFKICRYLLSQGANTDVAEYEGNFPLHLACQNGLSKSVRLLLSASKKNDVINDCNDDNRSPLMMAVSSQNIALVEFLLLKNANPNLADKRNVIALHLSAHSANFRLFEIIYGATSEECIVKYCTFNEERDLEKILYSGKINSVICLAIDTEDLSFFIKVLSSDINSDVLRCPVIHGENSVTKTFTLHTPISFLLECKMYDLAEATLEFLAALVKHGIPLKTTSKTRSFRYVDAICAAFVAMNDSSQELVLRCINFLLLNGADPDLPYGGMPFSMEQACMRSCSEAVLLLLQYSNVLEPDDVIRWIEQNTSSNQEKIVEILLPLAPYYVPTDTLLPNVEMCQRKMLLAPKVYPLVNYCRSIIRKQIHEEASLDKFEPRLFRSKLSQLSLPKGLYCFLNYM